MKKPLLFLYNPYAGKKEIVSELHYIIDYLTAHNFVVTAYPTQSNNDAYEKVVKWGKRFKYIVCAGGDGTLNETVHGIMSLSGELPILSYIPCGTTNDFANSRGIPLRLEDALANIVEGVVTTMDVGLLNNQHCFNYVAAFGLFTELSYDTSQNLKNIFGHTAYIVEGIKRLTNIKPISCVIELQDQIIEDEFLLGMITNSASIGGFKVPQGDFYHKNNFHLILLKYSPNLFEYQGIASTLLGLKEPGEQFIIAPIDSVKISSPEVIPWTIDGEFGGEYKENEIVIRKDKIKIILPDNKL